MPTIPPGEDRDESKVYLAASFQYYKTTLPTYPGYVRHSVLPGL
jgi:hypothetical protein